MLAPDALRQLRDEDEMQPESPLLLMPAAQEYGQSQTNERRRGTRRAGNTHRKTMDHAPQLGLATQSPAAFLLSQTLVRTRIRPSSEYFCHACRDRRR